MENDYECPKCHNTFPSQNKILHNIRCSAENPMTLDKNDQIQINIIKQENIEKENTEKENTEKENKQNSQIQTNYYYNINEIDYEEINSEQINNQNNSEIQKPLISESNDLNDNFICEICGEIINDSIKNDHMLCHRLENEEKEKERIDNQKLLDLKEKEIEQQKKLEKQIKLYNQIKQKKKIENQIKLQQQQQKIENEIRLQNEVNRRIMRLYFPNQGQYLPNQLQYHQNQGQGINNLYNPNMRNFLRPVKKNYDHPTDLAILNGLPEMSIDTSKLDDEKKSCMICLEDYNNGDKATTLPCIHLFHTNCIKNWLKKQNSCPICKFKLVKNNVNQ